MPLQRHFFLSDDLDDLELVEAELIEAGILAPQIHVLSRDNIGLHQREQLSNVSSFMKRDLIRSGLIGAIVGSFLVALLILMAVVFGWLKGPAGSAPVVIAALALFGACVWIGGLWGIQKPNHHFLRFKSELDAGKHVFFVDLDSRELRVLETLCAKHPGLEPAGTGEALPSWALALWIRSRSWWYWRIWKNA